MNRRIYLDNAATSFPKPLSVHSAMMAYATEIGASPGRGHYAESREGARLLTQCRWRLNEFLGGASPDHVIFTLNTSDALNLAIKGVVRQRLMTQPDQSIHIIATDMDHNSVLRPCAAAAKDPRVSITFVPADAKTGLVDPWRIAEAIRRETALVCINHVSNVMGTIQPIEVIGEICSAAGVLYLVDAAQSLGHVRFDAKACRADLVAFPGHKGLLGPQGTGGLYIRPGVEEHVATTREGGTGHLSEDAEQPNVMPQKFEAGSHNTMGLVGLSEGVAWLEKRGMHELRQHELELIELVLESLREGGAQLNSTQGDGALSDLRLVGPDDSAMRTGTFTFVHETLSPAEMVTLLEEEYGVLMRAGLHCAPRAHATGGTLTGESAGGFRMSLGPFVTPEDILASMDALREICTSTAIDSKRA